MIVLRDRTAKWNPRSLGELGECGIENVAANVVEKDVDSFRAMFSQRGRHVFLLVVDRRVEAEFFDDVLALLRSARNSDDAATLDLADLPDDAANGSRRG